MGQHHPQLGAAALLMRLLLQLVHLLQHPLRLRDEPLALLGGDHARGGTLENAHPVFLFQIFQRLADIGLRRVQLLCRCRHRPPFHDGYQIPQFRNIHEPLRVVCSRSRIVTISPRRCQAGRNFVRSRRAAGRFGMAAACALAIFSGKNIFNSQSRKICGFSGIAFSREES